MTRLGFARAALRATITLVSEAKQLDRLPPGTRALLDLALVDLHGLVTTITTCMSQQTAAQDELHRRAA